MKIQRYCVIASSIILSILSWIGLFLIVDILDKANILDDNMHVIIYISFGIINALVLIGLTIKNCCEFNN